MSCGRYGKLRHATAAVVASIPVVFTAMSDDLAATVPMT